MPSVTLHILGDASDVARAMGDVQGMAQRAEAAITGERRRGAQARTQVSRQEADAARQQARAELEVRRRAEREATAATRAESRRRAQIEREEGAARRRELGASTAAKHRAEREATANARRESRERERTSADEARAKIRHEREVTTAAGREERRRTQAARREAVERRNRATTIGRAAGTVLSAGAQVVSSAHGQIQDVRRTAAERESALNTTLIQTGAGATEASQTRERIMAQIRAARLNPDRVLPAIGEAQSFANALGGDTAQQRSANLDATMADVQFASNIDPENINGLVRLGALTRGRMTGDDRGTLLRAFAGIGFQGSVETDQTVTRGLPGLQEAWSAGTSGITDPAEASRRRLEIARDFAAQIQSQAASGRTVTVSANRANTVRTSLSNEDRQDRLGRAYAARRRTMTPEQQAAFDSTFTRGRDGRYQMNEGVRSSASNAARFFGTMHNNDATAMRNFLGTHGGGGNRQLMLVPDVSALASYFGTAVNSRGEQVRQYDYVDELARSTITPEREREIAEIRGSESSRALNDEENRRVEALSDNTSWLVKLSNGFSAWGAANPITAGALTAAGTGAAGAAGKALLPRLGALGGRVASSLGGRMGSVGGPVLGALASAYNVYSDVRSGRGLGESLGLEGLGQLGMGGAALSRIGGGGATAAAAQQGSVTVRLDPASAQAIGQSTARELAGTPLQVGTDLHTNATQGARNASGSTPPAP